MAEESAVFVGSQEGRSIVQEILQEANQPLAAHAALVCSQQSQKTAAVAK